MTGAASTIKNLNWQRVANLPIKDIFYYQHAWIDLLTQLYGYTVVPLITEDAQHQLTGFLPVCSINHFLVGKHLVSLPFSDYCPLWAADEATTHSLVDQAIELAH